MSKPVIAIDIDEVVADGTRSLCEQLNELNGTKITHADVHAERSQYDGFYSRAFQRLGLTFGMEYLRSDMTVDQSHVPLKIGAAEALAQLSEDYQLVALTARLLSWKKATLPWVSENLPGIFEQVIFSNEHPSGSNKMNIAQAEGIGYLIDDRVEYLTTGGSGLVKPVLFGDYGWHVDVQSDLQRCFDWQEVVEYFRGKS